MLEPLLDPVGSIVFAEVFFDESGLIGVFIDEIELIQTIYGLFDNVFFIFSAFELIDEFVMTIILACEQPKGVVIALL